MRPRTGIVLAGGGLASQRCAEALRSKGYDGRIRMICAEPSAPYDRPPLSKGVLTGEVARDSVAFRPNDWYAENGVELLIGRAAVSLDAAARTVTLDDRSCVTYEQLLIATGSRARRIPGFEGFANVHELRTVADATRLADELRGSGKLVIIGGGFIGQEVAASARKLGAAVTIIEALPLPLAGLLGEEVGRWLVDLHRAEGIEFETGVAITGASGRGRVEELELADGRRIACTSVLMGVGVAPAADWIRGSGLDPDGIRTDDCGRTGLAGVFAAGDVARPFDTRFGVHSRTEHWEAAAKQGAAAARAMLGEPARPAPLPTFWSDQHGLRIQYAGHAEQADEALVQPSEGDRELLVVYRRAGEPIAVLGADRPRDVLAFKREIELAHSSERHSRKHHPEGVAA